MATIQTLRPDLEPPIEASPVPPVATLPASPIQPFLSGQEDDRLSDMLAFALAARGSHPPTPEMIAALRQQALGELHGYAFRVLHNQVKEIRQQAVLDHLAGLRQPPGFLRLVSASLVALLLAGLAGAWFALHPDMLQALLAELGKLGI